METLQGSFPTRFRPLYGLYDLHDLLERGWIAANFVIFKYKGNHDDATLLVLYKLFFTAIFLHYLATLRT